MKYLTIIVILLCFLSTVLLHQYLPPQQIAKLGTCVGCGGNRNFQIELKTLRKFSAPPLDFILLFSKSVEPVKRKEN